MNPRRQRFADLVLLGRPASRAYREAGFNPKTDRSAEVEASKLLRNPEIVAYMEARRTAAAERAEITLAGVLRDLNAIGTDPEMPPQVRVNALAEVARRLPSGDGAVAVRIELDRPLTGEADQDAAIISAAALNAVAAGKLPPATGRIISQQASSVMDVAGLARLMRETAPMPAPLPPAPPRSETLLPHPRHPVWLKRDRSP